MIMCLLKNPRKKKEKPSSWDREGKGRTEITMFRCGEVKWTSETEQSEGLSSPLTPGLPAWQPSSLISLKSFPTRCHPERRVGEGVHAVNVWGLRRNGGRRIKGILSSKGLQKPGVLRLNTVTSKRKQSGRKRHFLWKESWSHNGLITAGHDANAVLLCA